MNERQFITSVTKRPGRPPSPITDGFYVIDRPTETMLILTELKNGGHSWREIASMIGCGTTPALLWKVAKGLCQSEVVDIALGLRLPIEKVERCGSCGKLHRIIKKCSVPRPQTRLAASVTEAERTALRAIAANYGLTWTELCKALAKEEIVTNLIKEKKMNPKEEKDINEMTEEELIDEINEILEENLPESEGIWGEIDKA